MGNALELAMLHRLGADGVDPSIPSKWSRGAVRVMLHWAAYPTWYWPVGQALELAIASHYMAVGYDWLFPVLTDEEKSIFLDAIVTKSLRQARSNYRMGLWWTRDIYNWNLVSNGGMVRGFPPSCRKRVCVCEPCTTLTPIFEMM